MTKRTNSFDALKLFCAFLVVCIHAPFSWEEGYVAAVSEAAVPVFFMISGFFYESVKERGREKIQVIKIVKLIIISNLFYLIWHLFIYGISGGGKEYLLSVFNLKALWEFLVFNESPVSIHLWYLGSFLYVLILVGFLSKKNLMDKVYWLIPILLLCDLVLGKYSIVIWGRDFYYLYSRNFLFAALPYFLLGCLIKKKKEIIINYFSNKRFFLPVLVALFAATTVIARYILIKNGLNATREHYLSTTGLALSLFFMALARKQQADNWLIKLGRENSTFIYIIHLFVKDVVALVVPDSLTGTYLAIRPVIVFVVSLIVSIIHNMLVHTVSQKCN